MICRKYFHSVQSGLGWVQIKNINSSLYLYLDFLYSQIVYGFFKVAIVDKSNEG